MTDSDRQLLSPKTHHSKPDAALIAYSSNHWLRAMVQAVPYVGGSIDTLLAGAGEKLESERVQDFLEKLDEELNRLTTRPSTLPSEELYDLTITIIEKITRTRSAGKRKRFAILMARQIQRNVRWDESEVVARLLGEMTDLHILVLNEAAAAPVCKKPFAGLQAFQLLQHNRQSLSEIVTLTTRLPDSDPQHLQLVCAELVGRGLLHDEGVGRLDTSAMEIFVLTDFGRWFLDWISEASYINSPK